MMHAPRHDQRSGPSIPFGLVGFLRFSHARWFSVLVLRAPCLIKQFAPSGFVGFGGG